MIRVAVATLYLLFFLLPATVNAQELRFPESEAVDSSQNLNASGGEFGNRNFEAIEGDNFTKTSYSENRQIGDVQPTDPRAQSSMLGGFFAFLAMTAIAGVAFVGWIIYRHKQAERREYLRDNWG